jgi:hypothetical protein
MNCVVNQARVRKITLGGYWNLSNVDGRYRIISNRDVYPFAFVIEGQTRRAYELAGSWSQLAAKILRVNESVLDYFWRGARGNSPPTNNSDYCYARDLGQSFTQYIGILL